MKAKDKHNFFLLIVLAGLVLGFSGCSTRRNTFGARLYHNLTSHYNVYWNGQQSLDKGIVYIHRNAKDNFNEVLRVYNYGNKEIAKQISPLMQQAIKKASLDIQQHSMIFNGKELIKWVENSYLLMGQANFYKQNYAAAKRIFNFIAKKYNYSPIQYRGMLWLSKTYLQAGDYEQADAQLNLLSSLLGEKDVPLSVKDRLPLVEADLFLAQKNTEGAYPFLEKGLKVSKNRDLRTRILFILGQINQLEGHLNVASNFFKRVIKRNPSFRLDFEARLRLATSYDTTQENHKYVQKTLEKMAKNHQYKQFLGKIYYAMAEVAEKSHQDTLMIHYLKLSVGHSMKNTRQKTTSAVKLAKIYFNRENYVSAEAYYDTAVQFLPKDYPDYEQLKKTASVLSQVVKYSQTIQVQDSLQRLGRMGTVALYAFVDHKIEGFKKVQKKEQKLRLESQVTISSSNFVNNTPTTNNADTWYFYNNVAKSRGYNEFKRLWGNRKLEDLWFLSEKQRLLPNGHMTNTLEKSTVSGKRPSVINGATGANNPRTRVFYLKNIPKTKKDFQASDSLIIRSYQKLGFLYLETLQDTAHALKTYLTLQQRFPQSSYRLQNWYYLYQIYSGLNRDNNAQTYKNLILNDYPNSLYAKVILDPNYFKERVSAHEREANLYSRTYQAFQHQQYYRTISYANRALNLYPTDSLLMPKFLFLKAISLGKVQVPDSLYHAMQQLVKTYPNSKLVSRAHAITQMLQKEYGIGITAAQWAALLAREKEAPQQVPYVFDTRAPQMLLLFVKFGDIQIKPLKVRLSDFNHKYFQTDSLEVKSISFNSINELIIIGRFDNVEKAGIYFRALKHDPYVFSGIQRKDYSLYIISLKNYPLFYRNKNIKLYQEFFKSHYDEK